MPQPADSSPTAPGAQLAELYRAHAPIVRRALRQLGVDEAQLDDAAQDVFVVLVRRIEDFDRGRSLTNWLWGIARGVASGYRRSLRRRGRLHGALPRPGPRDPRTLERAVAGEQAANILRDFLGSLDAAKYAVFVLSDVEGLSGPQIAECLAVNVNTVYARLRAARRSFREAIASHAAPDAAPLFAGLLPSIGKPSAWMTAAAVATVVALPLPSVDLGLDGSAPRLAGYLAIPNATAVSAASPVVEAVATSLAVGAAPVARPTAAPTREGDATLADGLDFPFGAASEGATEWAWEGQGLGMPTMLTTLALTAILAGPTTALDSDPDADDAARVDSSGPTAHYEFFDEELEGSVLRDDGTVILHQPRIQYTSLISVRGHFVPELIKLATDV